MAYHFPQPVSVVRYPAHSSLPSFSVAYSPPSTPHPSTSSFKLTHADANTPERSTSTSTPSTVNASACLAPTLNSNSKRTGKPPRPPNSFMIYRKEQSASYPKSTAAKLSKILGKKWFNETPECRAHYAQLAKKAEEEHALKYPDYKFMPAKRGTGKKARAMKAAANAALRATTTCNSSLQPPLLTAPFTSICSTPFMSDHLVPFTSDYPAPSPFTNIFPCIITENNSHAVPATGIRVGGNMLRKSEYPVGPSKRKHSRKIGSSVLRTPSRFKSMNSHRTSHITPEATAASASLLFRSSQEPYPISTVALQATTNLQLPAIRPSYSLSDPPQGQLFDMSSQFFRNPYPGLTSRDNIAHIQEPATSSGPSISSPISEKETASSLYFARLLNADIATAMNMHLPGESGSASISSNTHVQHPSQHQAQPSSSAMIRAFPALTPSSESPSALEIMPVVNNDPLQSMLDMAVANLPGTVPDTIPAASSSHPMMLGTNFQSSMTVSSVSSSSMLPSSHSSLSFLSSPSSLTNMSPTIPCLALSYYPSQQTASYQSSFASILSSSLAVRPINIPQSQSRPQIHLQVQAQVQAHDQMQYQMPDIITIKTEPSSEQIKALPRQAQEYQPDHYYRQRQDTSSNVKIEFPFLMSTMPEKQDQQQDISSYPKVESPFLMPTMSEEQDMNISPVLSTCSSFSPSMSPSSLLLDPSYYSGSVSTPLPAPHVLVPSNLIAAATDIRLQAELTVQLLDRVYSTSRSGPVDAMLIGATM
ncbi:hypothetical protein EDD11_001781 [Mortierella claussenii]|nr:hypothetical protein EDD11_001781 [Mortierella claussenii]